MVGVGFCVFGLWALPVIYDIGCCSYMGAVLTYHYVEYAVFLSGFSDLPLWVWEGRWL